MPYKTWVVGEEVLAADFNQYVQQQVVATFATAAARSSAIPAPQTGMVTWLTDAARLEVYNGTAWTYVSGGTWTAFVPPVLNVGQSAVTASVVYAKYARVGQTCAAQVRLAITGTSGGAGEIRVGLPVACSTNAVMVGNFTFIDASVGPNTLYHGGAYTIAGPPSYVSGIRDNVVGAAPMGAALGNGDVVNYSVSYEVA